MALIAGIGEVDSAEPSYVLWDMSRMVAGSEELTAAFDAGVAGLLGRLADSGSADAQAFLAAGTTSRSGSGPVAPTSGRSSPTPGRHDPRSRWR